MNLALQVGGSNVVVEVTAAGTELQTMNATVGNTVTAIALDNLPSLNRDVSTFVELQPGVSPDGSVAGAVVDQSSFMLDGGNNTNDMDGSMSVYTSSFAGDPTGGISNQSFAVAGGPTGVMPTPADSVEEFKVNSAGQTADFNSSAGAEVQVVTRRGTNTYHGSAYEYYLDNNWSANTWDNNLTGYSRFPIGTAVVSARASEARSCPICWAEKLTSSPTTKGIAGPIPRPFEKIVSVGIHALRVNSLSTVARPTTI